jgi:signal transduction histidine kinase
LLALATGGLAAEEAIPIAEAQFLQGHPQGLPPADAPWRPVPLPSHIRTDDPDSLKTVWYRVAFQVHEAALSGEPLAVYIPSFFCAFTLYLNGTRIGLVAPPSEAYHPRLKRPYQFLLPDTLLQRGENFLLLRGECRGFSLSLAGIWVGPERDLTPRYEERMFWQITAAKISSTLGILAGAAMLIVWSRRRKEVSYGLFALASLFWGVHSATLVREFIPATLWTEWRALYYFLTGGFCIPLILFFLRESERRWPWVERLLLAYWLAAPLGLLLFGLRERAFMDTYWLAGLFLLMLLALGIFAARTVRYPSSAGYAMLAASVFAVLLGLNDYLFNLGISVVGAFGLHLGVPAMLLAITWALTNRFVQSLAVVENLNVLLETRLAERERELAQSYDRLRGFERQQAMTEERQRIVSDMHDGLGSHLISSLALVESGSAGAKEVAGVLREGIDELRLVIDALGPEEGDLISALGNLRFRLAPRFSAAGISLRWDASGLQDTLEVSPAAGLQVLRILQEALTNVLKHSRARAVSVSLAAPGGREFHLRVEDDGIGLPANLAASGQGLPNMRRRAEALGGRLELASEGGTSVHLFFPLGGADPGAR